MFWWVIFGLGGLLGMMAWGCEGVSEKYPDDKIAKYGFFICGALSVALVVLCPLGWVWYWLCGGWRVCEGGGIFDVIAYGFVSLILLGILLGFIAMIFGWNPFK